MAGSASSSTVPPSPPSPPSGPPRGTNFSRRKLTHPAPPSPPLTKISISSTNMADLRDAGKRAEERSGGLLGDADELVVALALEPHVPVGLGEQGMIHADADVDSRLEAGTALPHQNAARGHELAPEALDPEHLRVGVPAVSRAPDTLLVRHEARPRSW